MSKKYLKILVSGANGYIGAHLSKALIDKGFNVLLTDLQPFSIINYKKYYPVNMVKPKNLEAIVKDVDILFFCTGRTGTEKEGFYSPADFILGNEVTLVNLLEFMIKTSSKARVIFPSTRLLYCGNSNNKLNEDSNIEAKTIYAINKLACEKYLQSYSRCFSIDYTIFRISLPYGTQMNLERISYGVLPFLISRAKTGGDLKIYGDGLQKRSLIHIDDLTEILILGSLMEETNNKIFNIGGPDIMEMGRIIKAIADHYKVSCTKVPWPELSLLVESGDTVLDSSRIESLLKYKYKYRFLEWLQSQKQL